MATVNDIKGVGVLDGGILAPSTMLTVQELATLLHVHPNTLRIWNNRGLLRAFRLGPRGDLRFRSEDVANFLNSHGAEFGVAAEIQEIEETAVR